jgi:hypothetical protein
MNLQPITSRSRLPRFQRVKRPPHMVMTERDRRILHAIYDYRMLTRAQIERLLFAPDGGQDHFTKTSKAQLRLKLLYQNKYLERVPMPVGNATWAWQPVYRLARTGAELVASRMGVNLRDLIYWGKGDDQTQRTTDVTTLFLTHALRIHDVRIAMTIAAMKCGYQIETWLDDGQLKCQEQKDYVAVTEQGRSKIVAVIPDAYFILHLGDRRARFFLELDRATMSNSRWGERIRAYLAYVQSGKYSARYQATSLRILTVTTTEQRLMNLKETTKKAGGDDLFWFTTFDQVSPSSVFFDPIWRLANDERDSVRKSLLG